MTKKDLTEMSVQELEAHARDVARELARKEAQRLNELRKKVEDYAVSLGTSISELFGKRTKSESQPKSSKQRAPLYKDDAGKEYFRASPKWTEAQKEKFRIRTEEG